MPQDYRGQVDQVYRFYLLRHAIVRVVSTGELFSIVPDQFPGKATLIDAKGEKHYVSMTEKVELVETAEGIVQFYLQQHSGN